MLGRFFHWVYCLPLGEAVLWALGATVIFLGLHALLHRWRWWRFVRLGLLVLWAGAMAWVTVFQWRGEKRALSLVPFQCYITVLKGGEKELLRSAFMNGLLFYPGGLLAGSLWKRRWLLTGIFAGVSVVLELCQYSLRLGTTETDDVIHNTLGAALGLAILWMWEKYRVVASRKKL
jgi:glycopeptide antibiotics resistance protein